MRCKQCPCITTVSIFEMYTSIPQQWTKIKNVNFLGDPFDSICLFKRKLVRWGLITPWQPYWAIAFHIREHQDNQLFPLCLPFYPSCIMVHNGLVFFVSGLLGPLITLLDDAVHQKTARAVNILPSIPVSENKTWGIKQIKQPYSVLEQWYSILNIHVLFWSNYGQFWNYRVSFLTTTFYFWYNPIQFGPLMFRFGTSSCFVFK